jgi:hypothetical protein
MLRTHVSRVTAGAVISAALAVGSLSLTATAASTCTTPDCIRGVPPAAAAAALECSDPSCLSGTRPAAAPPGSRLAGRAGHGGPSASAHADTATASAATINCPPPNPEVTDPVSDC